MLVIKELLKRDLSAAYHLADDKSLFTNELVTEIANNLALKPRLWKIPEPFIRSLAKLGDKLRLPLTTERLQKLTES